jgi:hypothetical protein
MKKSYVTEKEASIIKYLLEETELTNKEIVEIINNKREQDDQIQPARISDIKLNKTKKFIGTKKAPKKIYEQFIKPKAIKKSPVSKNVLDTALEIDQNKQCHLNISEASTFEFKESFQIKLDYLYKPICALANNRGGYILFGIKDKTLEIVGLKDKHIKKFNEWDLEKLDGEILSTAGKQVQLYKTIYNICDKKIGVIYVEEAKNKPLITLKNGKNDDGTHYNQGSIYYRNNSSSRLIGAQDLNDIIEERAKNLLSTSFIKHIHKIIEIGPDNAAILDTNKGEIIGKSDNLIIDEELLSQVQFIKEGEFAEKRGAPTLKLVGNVQDINYTKIEQIEKSLDLRRVIELFLNNELENKSLEIKKGISRECIKHISLLPNKITPIFYFIKLRETSNKNILSYLDSLRKSLGKENFIKKTKEYIEFPDMNSVKPKIDLSDTITNKNEINTDNLDTVNSFLDTLRNLNKDQIDLIYCKETLLKILNKYWITQKVKTKILYTCSYIDILFYKDN